MAKKIACRVRNWKKYNRSLINRGNLTLWFSEDAIKSWYQKPQKRNKRGRPLTYSNAYVELALTLRSLFRFPLRATQGFLEGLVSLMGLQLEVSHYSRLSRRAADLDIQLNQLKKRGKNPTDLVIDSTGLKIYGEGEWKMRIHGKQKRRTWRKYHVAINPASHEVMAIELTKANVHDCAEAGGVPVIPLRSGTGLVKKDPSKGELLRNQLVLAYRQPGGKRMWKKTSGYHKRSLAETHMFRLKAILGASLRGRKFENQQTEARIMAKILNEMTRLGMPKSEAII